MGAAVPARSCVLPWSRVCAALDRWKPVSDVTRIRATRIRANGAGPGCLGEAPCICGLRAYARVFPGRGGQLGALEAQLAAARLEAEAAGTEARFRKSLAGTYPALCYEVRGQGGARACTVGAKILLVLLREIILRAWFFSRISRGSATDAGSGRRARAWVR